MTLYRVTLTTFANTSVEVEADDPEQARTLAEESGEFPTLCHQCSDGCDLGDEWTAVPASEVYEVET